MSQFNEATSDPTKKEERPRSPADIADLAISELETVLDALPALVWISHVPGGAVMNGNRAANEFLGMSPGSNPSLTGPESSRPVHFSVYRDGRLVDPTDLPLQRSSRGEMIRNYREEIVFADGRTHTIYGNASPLYDAHGEIRGSVAAFVDVTTIVNEIAAKEISAREAKALAKARSKTLAEVSHDLRQPLTIIQAALDRLRRLAKTDKDVAYLDRAQRSTDRIIDGMDVLLKMSEVDAMETVLFERVRLQDVMDELDDQCGPIAQAKGLVLKTVRTSACIVSNRHLLSTILHNLVGNAIKYTSSGKVIVGVRQRPHQLSIEIHDTGIGIPGDKIGAIFDDFTRLHRQQATGTGLGLSIVRRCSELINAKIDVMSTVGKGSRFAVKLPRNPED